MGKEDKEESGFGFKDKQKALETLRLLEAHDAGYRRLTVRGLLGRARRVLSLTKAEDKIKNIKEAMEVFENWLSDLDANKNKDGDKKSETKDKKPVKKAEKEEKMEEGSDNEHSVAESSKSPEPTDSVPGLGFRDASAARDTLAALSGRDPDYQRLAVKGLIGRAKRVLTCTKDEIKLSNIKEAMSILEKFLDDFDSQHLSKQNNPYLSLGVVTTCLKHAEDRNLDVAKQKSFIAAYASVNGEYKKLRTVKDGDRETWDIVRNQALTELKEKHADAKLFNDKDEPTDEHLQLLLWAYSPEASKVKKLIPETRDDKRETRKRRSSGDGDSTYSKKKK